MNARAPGAERFGVVLVDGRLLRETVWFAACPSGLVRAQTRLIVSDGVTANYYIIYPW